MSMYTAPELARMFGVGKGSVYKRLAAAGIEPVKVVKKGVLVRRFYGDDAVAYLDGIGWERAGESGEVVVVDIQGGR